MYANKKIFIRTNFIKHLRFLKPKFNTVKIFSLLIIKTYEFSNRAPQQSHWVQSQKVFNGIIIVRMFIIIIFEFYFVFNDLSQKLAHRTLFCNIRLQLYLIIQVTWKGSVWLFIKQEANSTELSVPTLEFNVTVMLFWNLWKNFESS